MHTDILRLGERSIEYRFAEPTVRRGSDIVMLHEGLGSTSMWRDFPERLAAATDEPHAGVFTPWLRTVFAAR